MGYQVMYATMLWRVITLTKMLDLQLNVNNLSDKRYFTKAYASHYATEAEGRSAVLSVNFKY